MSGKERWLSGRKRRSRKPEYGQPYRGFESHSLRHLPIGGALPRIGTTPLGIPAGRRGQFPVQQTGDGRAETGFATVVVRFPHRQCRVVD